MSRRPRRAQRGFTLIELLMGIALSSVFALALFGFFFSNVDAARTHESQARAQAGGRLALDRMADDIRQAISPDGGVTPPVISLSPTVIELYVDPSRATSATTPRPQKVRYTFAGGTLTREAVAPVGVTAPYSYGSYGQSEVLVDSVANGATALFSASDEDGTALPATLTAAQLRDVAQISIKLLIGQKTGNKATTMELDTDVALRNALSL